MVQGFRVGVYLFRLALSRHGSDSFWSAVSWWHEEVHYTIPRIEEEKKVAEELKAAFEVTDSVDLEEWLSNKVSPLTFPITSSLTPITTTALDVTNNVFTISPPSGDKGYAGQWRWIGVGVNVVNRPSWLRRTTVSVLLGEEWVEEGGSKAKVKETPLPSEYTRWDEFLSETQ